MRVLLLLLSLTGLLFASGGGGAATANPDLTHTWVGIAGIIVFVFGYYFIAAEEIYHSKTGIVYRYVYVYFNRLLYAV